MLLLTRVTVWVDELDEEDVTNETGTSRTLFHSGWLTAHWLSSFSPSVFAFHKLAIKLDMLLKTYALLLPSEAVKTVLLSIDLCCSKNVARLSLGSIMILDGTPRDCSLCTLLLMRWKVILAPMSESF